MAGHRNKRRNQKYSNKEIEMTRAFNEKVKCPNCGCIHPAEIAFRQWIRNCPDLDSSPKKAAVVLFDCDILLHKYLIHSDKIGNRDIQAMMFIEVKANMSEPTESQRDTLYIFNQILRNRRPTPAAKYRKRQAENNGLLTKVFSSISNKWINIRLFGGHLLQMSDDNPFDSHQMRWDKREVIDYNTLLQLLRFEIDPDTLRTIEWRRHHKSQNILFK